MRNTIRVACLLALVLALAPIGVAPAAARSDEGVMQPANSIVLQIDRPAASDQIVNTGWFGGWAVDQNIATSPGIGQIAVYMDGDATNGRYLGLAQLGGNRPDVAAHFGNANYALAGWNFGIAHLGITGAHSFTFVAFGVQGPVFAKSVDAVTLVAPAPPVAYAPPAPTYYGYTPAWSDGTVYAPPYYGYGANYYAGPTVYGSGGVPLPAFGYSSRPWPVYYTNAGSTYSYNTAQPAWVGNTSQPTGYYQTGTNLYTGTGSTSSVPTVNLPQYALPAGSTSNQNRVVGPVALSISSPASGSSVGTSFQVAGVTGAVPYSGAITYTLTNRNGVTVASGSLITSGIGGQSGSFAAAVSYQWGTPGYGTLTITETDGGLTVGSTSITVFLAN